MNDQLTCTSCGMALSGKSLYVVCGVEYKRPGDGTTASPGTWERADVWKVPFGLCDSCVPAISERYLQARLKSARQEIVKTFFALVGVLLFLLVASTGIFINAGSVKLFLVFGVTILFLYGLFGLPYYSYRLLRGYGQIASLRQRQNISDAVVKVAVKLEAETLLKNGKLRTPDAQSPQSHSGVPEGLPLRETVLASGEDDEELMAGCPEEWKPWLKRRV